MTRANVVDQVFAALAEPTRRAMLERLSHGPATVSDLAKPFGVTLAAIMQHLQVLEQSGLVRSEKIGRVRTCSIETSGLRLAEQWLEQRRSLWERRFDRLGALLDEEDDSDTDPQAPPPEDERQKVMSELSVVHGTFSIERTYKHSPAKVFAAFQDPKKKKRWFAEGEGWEVEEFSVDFRVNGSEHSCFRFQGGPEITNDTVYADIVPDRRIVVTYTMAIAGKRISSSLATTQLVPEGHGTRLIYTEQAAFLDSGDGRKEREEGCRGLFEALERELQRED